MGREMTLDGMLTSQIPPDAIRDDEYLDVQQIRRKRTKRNQMLVQKSYEVQKQSLLKNPKQNGARFHPYNGQMMSNKRATEIGRHDGKPDNDVSYALK